MSSISKSWGELIWPDLWRELERSGFSEQANIQKVYFLNFGLLDDKNVEKYLSLLEKRDFRRLQKFQPYLPADFDERVYDYINLVYIETNSNKFLGVSKQFRTGRHELVRLIEIKDLDLEAFRGKMQVYPV